MKKLSLTIFVVAVLLISTDAFAVLNNNGVLDTVVTRFQTATTSWTNRIYTSATYLFWLLATISMVWTFGFMALRKADVGEFFAEFIKFTLFIGFFKWILDNGTNFATDIIISLRSIAAIAGGVPNAITPSGIVDVGFDICFKIIDNSSLWNPVDTAITMILGVVILVVLALIAINMVVLLCSSWFLLYGGIFFLGFGGSKWTCDMAINYYKTVLNVAIQLFTMILLIGTGQNILDNYHAQMTASLPYKELVVMLVISIVLYVLVNKVPALLASIVTGGLGGAAGGGSAFTGGAALGAVALGASALAGGAAAMGGGASAIKAAIAASGSGGGGGMANTASAVGSSIGSAFSGSTSGGGGESSSGSSDGFLGGGSAEAAFSGSSETSGDQPSGSSESSSGSPQSKTQFAASVVQKLARGTSQVMKETVGDRLSQTTGGKIADAIRNNAEPPSKPGMDEIKQFVDKK